jgi:phosphopantetheine adenylyltransferase
MPSPRLDLGKITVRNSMYIVCTHIVVVYITKETLMKKKKTRSIKVRAKRKPTVTDFILKAMGPNARDYILNMLEERGNDLAGDGVDYDSEWHMNEYAIHEFKKLAGIEDEQTL